MEQKNKAMPESIELSAEELAGVTGGSSTQDLYDPEECMSIKRPCDRCYGGVASEILCDQCSVEILESKSDGSIARVRCICAKGCYDTTLFMKP